MTINNPMDYCAGIWDWGFLRRAFTEILPRTKVEVSDVDGFASALLFDPDLEDKDNPVYQVHGHVHRNGHHVLYEAKNWDAGRDKPSPILSRSQQITHTDLVKVGFSIVCLFGPANRFPVQRVRVWKEFAAAPVGDYFDVSENQLVGWTRNWFIHANRWPLDLSGVSALLKAQINVS